MTPPKAIPLRLLALSISSFMTSGQIDGKLDTQKLLNAPLYAQTVGGSTVDVLKAGDSGALEWYIECCGAGGILPQTGCLRLGGFFEGKGSVFWGGEDFFPSGLAIFWQLSQEPKMATWGIPGGASSRGLLVAFAISMKFPPRPRPESATKWTTPHTT